MLNPTIRDTLVGIGRDGKILSDHRQDDNVAVAGIGYLAGRGPSPASEM